MGFETLYPEWTPYNGNGGEISDTNAHSGKHSLSLVPSPGSLLTASYPYLPSPRLSSPPSISFLPFLSRLFMLFVDGLNILLLSYQRCGICVDGEHLGEIKLPRTLVSPLHHSLLRLLLPPSPRAHVWISRLGICMRGRANLQRDRKRVRHADASRR